MQCGRDKEAKGSDTRDVGVHDHVLLSKSVTAYRLPEWLTSSCLPLALLGWPVLRRRVCCGLARILASRHCFSFVIGSPARSPRANHWQRFASSSSSCALPLLPMRKATRQPIPLACPARTVLMTTGPLLSTPLRAQSCVAQAWLDLVSTLHRIPSSDPRALNKAGRPALTASESRAHLAKQVVCTHTHCQTPTAIGTRKIHMTNAHTSTVQRTTERSDARTSSAV